MLSTIERRRQFLRQKAWEQTVFQDVKLIYTDKGVDHYHISAQLGKWNLYAEVAIDSLLTNRDKLVIQYAAEKAIMKQAFERIDKALEQEEQL